MRLTMVTAAVTVTFAVTGLGACSTEGMAFREDRRVRFVSPADRATVTLPLVLRWEVVGDGPTPERFAVFFDRSPVPPGKTLRWLARDDQACLETRGCPDETWLARHDVYRTTASSLEVQTLRDTRLDRGRRRGQEGHEARIILLDDTGRRRGEASFEREFFVDRR